MESRKIKVLMLVAITVGTTVLAGLPSTLAGDFDTFTVTVKGQYLTLSIAKESWSVNGGTAVAMSTAYNTTVADTFTADVTGSSSSVDLKLQITTDGATWKSDDAAGADKYTLYSSIDAGSTWPDHIITASATTISSGVATTETFDLKFNSPTSTTTGTLQTITVTATGVLV
jgi:hypothetical protein